MLFRQLILLYLEIFTDRTHTDILIHLQVIVTLKTFCIKTHPQLVFDTKLVLSFLHTGPSSSSIAPLTPSTH